MRFLKKTILFFIIGLALMQYVFSEAKINGFVNDYANIIPADEKIQTEAVAKELYDSGVAQYSIVTIKSLEGKDIESYALNLAQGNLGATEKNNGLLLLVAVDDRQYRFEVGRGIEYVLNDAKVGRIARTYIVDNFRNGDYGKGILEASLAVKSILLGDNLSEYYVAETEQYDLKTIEIFIYVVLFLIFFIIILVASAKQNKKNKGKYFDAAMGAIILFGGRGRGGFGGGSGGFGGFGGGSFGGGGASGGW